MWEGRSLWRGVRDLEKMLVVERLTEGLRKVDDLESRVSILESRVGSGIVRMERMGDKET